MQLGKIQRLSGRTPEFAGVGNVVPALGRTSMPPIIGQMFNDVDRIGDAAPHPMRYGGARLDRPGLARRRAGCAMYGQDIWQVDMPAQDEIDTRVDPGGHGKVAAKDRKSTRLNSSQ